MNFKPNTENFGKNMLQLDQYLSSPKDQKKLKNR